MINPKLWPKINKEKKIYPGWSSISNKDVKGFYKNRINTWKKHLNKGEIFIIESFMKNQLIKNNYKLSGITKKNQTIERELTKFNNCVNKSYYLKKAIYNLKIRKKGTYNFANDPTDPHTWGAGRKNKVKFISTAAGKKYIKILKNLKKKYL